jgi:hypothetical protein
MTPTATTPAGRTGQGTGGSSRASQSHPRSVRRQPTPRTPRRVSGPTAGRGAPGQRPSARPPSALPAKTRAFLKSLPDHPVIDRLVRGRAWILALGIMLAGIVAMQVELLKLGANIGRSVQRSSALAVRNEQLQSSVAALADDQRIEKQAAGLGMVMAPPGAVGFLSPGNGGTSGAAPVRPANATTFQGTTSTNGSLVTPAAIAAANAPVGSTTTATQTSTAASGGAMSGGAMSASTTSSPATTTSSAATTAVTPAVQTQPTTPSAATTAGG